jgi:hypothetical protein
MKRHQQRQGDSAEAKILRKNISNRKHERQKPVVIQAPPPFTVTSLARMIENDSNIQNAKGGVRSLGFRWKDVKQALKARRYAARRHAAHLAEAVEHFRKPGCQDDGVEWVEGRKAFCLYHDSVKPVLLKGHFKRAAIQYAKHGKPKLPARVTP